MHAVIVPGCLYPFSQWRYLPAVDYDSCCWRLV